MAERRGGTKGRRMGSSRRKQLREGSSEAPPAAPSPGEEPPQAAEIVQRVQDFFKEQDKDQAGLVTRSDMKKLQEEDFPCSTEELELVFDGLDAAGTGRLRTEEFTAGLYQFMSSQKAARDHRRRKTASRRVRLVLPSPAEEGADSEERRHFAAFMEQLGTDNISEEKEIWQLWVTLRQDNPQLLGNLEDFLAKMRHRIQEARSKKAALEVTLNKRVAEHDKEVQQLCEAMEQQIQQEKQRLEHESMARSHQHSEELRRALDASEREVQRLVRAQMELETRCRSLRSTQQATSTENRQLEESNHELEDRLQHLHQQLQETQGCLQRLRAAVAWEHTEEFRDRAVAELPGETPVSPQTSPVTSEKHHSKMQIGLWSQSDEPKAKRTHQVVWEMPPAEISHLGALQRVSSTEEDSFSEFLKEERFSDQSSLLREMNDAIAALSKQLKPQAPGAPPVPADAAPHSRDDAESQAGLEAASASSLLQETLLGHISHEVFQGDLTEGPATAQLNAPDVTEAGASAGAGHHGVQELGAEQGESPEEAWRMLFLQGKGTGVKELVLKAAEHPQGAPGESTEAGELVEVEGVGGMQEKTGWEKARPLGEAEEVALSQGENQETGLGPPEAGEAGLAAGWQLGPAAALEEGTEPWSTGLEEEAGEPLGRTEELEIQPGEHLEPEPPSWGQADGSPAEVTWNPGSGMLAEECVHVEVQPWGETLDANVPPARHGGSSRAGAGKGEVEVRQPTEAEPQGESVTDATMWGGREGGEELLPVAVPPGGTGTDVQLLEAQSGDANMQLLAEVDADLQPPSKWGSLGPEQGGSGAPGVQPLEEVNKAELGVGEEPSAATVHGEGPSPAETPAEVADVGGLLPVKAQALELVRAEESWAHTQLCEDPSPEAPQGSGDYAAMQLGGEDEDGGQGQGEHEMPHEPLMQHHGAGFRQESGAGAEEQPATEGDKHSAGRGDPAPLPTVLCRGQRPGVEKSGGVHYSEEAWDLGLVQGEGINKDGLLLVKAQALELVEAAESWIDVQLRGGLSPETPQEGEGPAAVELMEKAEEGAHRQGEHEVPCELDPRGAEARQGEGAGAGVQPWEEAAILDALEDQSSDANMQLFAEAVELELTPGGSTETDLQPLSEAGYLGREQGMSVAPDVQIQGQADKLELMEMEAEDAQADTELGWGLSSEVPRGGEGGAAMQLTEEAEDGAHGQSECELPHELDPQGGGVGEGAGAGVQSQEEAVILDRLEDQSSDANMQLLAEAVELELTPGQSMEADLQPLSKAGSLDTEQGMSVAPDVQLHGEVEAEDLHADTQLCGVVSSETLQGGEGGADVELLEEAEDGVQGQDKHGLPQEPVLHPHGVAIAQGEGASEDVQPWEEAVILDTLEDQSTEAHVQLRAEVDELKLTPGCRTEADLQPLSQVGSLDTKQGGCGYVAPDVQLQSQVDKPETVELVEAEVSWVDTQLHGVASPEILQGWRHCAAVHLLEEAEDGAQGKGECELPQEPVLDPQGAGVRQGERAGAGGQPWEEAVILDTPADQSSDAHMQPHSEVYELKTAPGGGMEADPGTLSEAGSMDTGQGRAVAPGVQPLDQVNEPESVETEAENSWVDVQLRGGLSPETFQGPGSPSAVELVEEAEEGAQGQGEFELPQSTLQPQRTRAVKGEGAGAGVQLWEEAAIVDTLDNQSSDANMQPLIELEELKSILGGSTEADLAILDAAGMQEGEQSQAPGPEAGLCAAHSSDTLEGPAGAHVSSPAEATFYPERAAAPEGPGLEAKLGAPTGPDGHILGDSQTLELQLGERAAAERRPLDGAQGLEVVQGERLEAGVRSLLETYGLGIKQGHDDAASALAPPVSEVSLQTSTLKLETMMQEDVLVPDVRRLGPSAQAVQSELQEQVSAQADKVRLGIASQQPEEKPPHVMETELVAARPSEPPKQEVPPASTLHTEVQREEDAGNDQLGMVLGDSSLGDAANSSRQHQRQLSGEHSKDLSARQMEKKQEVQRKLSQEGEPSSGAVTADGAGAAPRGSPEAPLEPDHLYNVLFVGDSHVGKTSFLYRLHADTFNPHLTATVGLDYQIKNLVVDNKRFALRLWDSAGQERYHSITKQFFRKADGVVLMYDITSEHSFADVRYWLSCIQEGAEDGVAILLLGNKTDCAAERQVPTKEGERLAKEHQLMFYECSAASGHNVSESMVSLIRLLKVHEDELKKKAQEVSKPPQKKKGCCW